MTFLSPLSENSPFSVYLNCQLFNSTSKTDEKLDFFTLYYIFVSGYCNHGVSMYDKQSVMWLHLPRVTSSRDMLNYALCCDLFMKQSVLK